MKLENFRQIFKNFLLKLEIFCQIFWAQLPRKRSSLRDAQLQLLLQLPNAAPVQPNAAPYGGTQLPENLTFQVKFRTYVRPRTYVRILYTYSYENVKGKIKI